MRPDHYNNCHCNQSSGSRDCCNSMSSLAQGPGCPAPMPPKDRTCCCKKSMSDALKLLCDSQISDYIDYHKFAFLSPTFLVGTKLILIELGNEEKDNLAELDGEFKRFTVGNCDTIDIAGTAVYNIPIPFSLAELAEDICAFLERIITILEGIDGTGTLIAILREILNLLMVKEFSEAVLRAILDFLISWFTVLPEVNQASLCEIQAIAFELEYVSDYQYVKSALQEHLEHTESKCGECRGHCQCDDCCCNDGIKFGLLSASASQTVTLTAGSLILQRVQALGSIGSTLVFGNEREGRFYFVCADTVQFLG